MTTVLSCNGLSAGYAGTKVVRDLNLDVQAGEIVALVGPNGAGKTTVLMTLAGVLRPIAGSCSFDGETVKTSTHVLARRGLLFVPEHGGCLTGLTTRENLEIGRRGRRDLPVATVIEHFPELDSRMDVKAGLLSGGERQMLAMARALVNRPRALMIDEMSLGLAPVVVQRLMTLLPVIVEETGCGVLLVEQMVHDALSVSTRAVVLNHGDVVARGNSKELLENRNVIDSAYLQDAGPAAGGNS
jgi:branched-chain amino acid transport system ATP-binding protein